MFLVGPIITLFVKYHYNIHAFCTNLLTEWGQKLLSTELTKNIWLATVEEEGMSLSNI